MKFDRIFLPIFSNMRVYMYVYISERYKCNVKTRWRWNNFVQFRGRNEINRMEERGRRWIDLYSFAKETRFASKLEDARSIEARAEGSCIGREIRIDQGEEGDGSRRWSRLPRRHVSPKAVKSEGRTRPWGKDSRHFRLALLRYLRFHRGDNSCPIPGKKTGKRSDKEARLRKDNDPTYVEKGPYQGYNPCVSPSYYHVADWQQR